MLNTFKGIYMLESLSHTQTHTHTHSHTRLCSSHTGAKKLFNTAPLLFINNSLNTESLHCIFQQREDKIAVFEVRFASYVTLTLYSLTVKRDAQTHTHFSLSLNIWEKGLSMSNYWGIMLALQSVYAEMIHSIFVWRALALPLTPTPLPPKENWDTPTPSCESAKRRGRGKGKG